MGDDIELTATLICLLRANWTDDRLREVNYRGQLQLEEIGWVTWMPMLEIENQAEEAELVMENVRFNQDFDGNDLPATGQVFLSRQIQVEVFVDFDYWAFPFDTHLLPIEVASFAYGSDALTIRSSPITGIIPEQKNIAWKILGTKT